MRKVKLSGEASKLLDEAQANGGKIWQLSTGEVDTTAPIEPDPAVQENRRRALKELPIADAVRHVDGVLYEVCVQRVR